MLVKRNSMLNRTREGLTQMRQRGWMLAAATVMVCVLSACRVSPDYVKPTVAVPSNYKENEGWQVAQPKDATLRGNWWEMFSDPQLNALEEQVDISNQNVARAEAQFRQARALVQQARASYFPTVTIGVGLNNFSKSTTIARTAGMRRSLMLYSLPIDVSWEIDVWVRIRRLVQSSQAVARASAQDLETARSGARTE